jgi:translation elongation factor EF-1alpha
MEFNESNAAEFKTNHGLNTHEIPPSDLCTLFREYQCMNISQITNDLRVIDFNRGLTNGQKLKLHVIDKVDKHIIESVTKTFDQTQRELGFEIPNITNNSSSCVIYEHTDFPGRLQH